jgi:GDPmannose 4,6-dehydratase
MTKAIIFGINGQDGFYLSQLLQQYAIEVIGISRTGNFLKTDITSYEQVATLVKEQQPSFIFHLAANSTTRHDALFENHHTISTGTLNILEAVKEFSVHTKVFISGSGLQFKNEDKPIKETDAFQAKDAYSVSRIQSVFAARYFRQKFGVQVYIGYFFNHDSPRRSERHVAKKIVDFVHRIANGSKEKLEIGDIHTIKEWTFAGDVVNAIWVFINQNAIYECNLGSGIGYSIEEWLSVCFSLVNKDWKDYTTHTKNFKAEYKQLISDSSLIQAMGWKPTVSLKQLAQLMLKEI